MSEILAWTKEHFGGAQQRVYRETIRLAVRALERGPLAPGSRSRDEIRHGLRTIPVARQGRRSRHLLLYRADADQEIVIIRILHERMDLRRHLTSVESQDP